MQESFPLTYSIQQIAEGNVSLLYQSDEYVSDDYITYKALYMFYFLKLSVGPMIFWAASTIARFRLKTLKSLT